MKINWENIELLDKYNLKLHQDVVEDIFIDETSLKIIDIVFVENEYIKSLNKEYRGKDEATDVLSFNLDEGEGEIYLSLEYLKKESEDLQKEVYRMIIHGVLHIMGYDHKDYFYEDNIKEEMYIIQEEYLAKLYKVIEK